MLDSKGFRTEPEIPYGLEKGTIYYSPDGGYREVVITYFDGRFSTQKAHTRNIIKLKTAMLIEGISPPEH